MAEEVVLLDCPALNVARLLINRPEKRNAIDHAVLHALIERLTGLLADGHTRAVVFGGVDGVFSAGGDLPSMLGLTEEQARDRMRHVHVLCRLVADAGVPVVSAMEGVSAGAAVGLALLGDRIVIGRNARILFPFLQLGLTPDWGQLLTLPRRIGLPMARRLLCDGQPVSGEEALRIGLADHLVDDNETMNAAVQTACGLAALPADAFARMKQRLYRPSTTLAEELAREEDDQAACLLGADFREGYDAFRGKRKSDFVERPGARE